LQLDDNKKEFIQGHPRTFMTAFWRRTLTTFTVFEISIGPWCYRAYEVSIFSN